jgi:hypothetical protein
MFLTPLISRMIQSGVPAAVIGLGLLLLSSPLVAETPKCKGTKVWFKGECRYPEEVKSLKKKIEKSATRKRKSSRKKSKRKRDIRSVSTAQELVDAIGNNRTILLEPGTYRVDRLPPLESEHVKWRKIDDGFELTITDVRDMQLVGGVGGPCRVITGEAGAWVLRLMEVQDVMVRNLVFGHVPESGPCQAGVLLLEKSRRIALRDLDMFGSGTIGLEARQVSGLTLESSTIRECTSEGAARFRSCDGVVISSCEISNNHGVNQILELSDCKGMVISETVFSGNESDGVFIRASADDEVKIDTCRISNNRSDRFYFDDFQPEERNNVFHNNSWSRSLSAPKPRTDLPKPRAVAPKPRTIGPTPEGAWRDGRTGLVWQKTPSPTSMVWAAAANHCRGLDLEGRGWRMPTINELRSIVRGCQDTESDGVCSVGNEGCLEWSCRDHCKGCAVRLGPAEMGCYWSDELEGDCSWFWSASPVKGEGDAMWGVGFDEGTVDVYSSGYGANVRCVRSTEAR